MAEIEYVTIANHAEAINGLLYLAGAGWTDHWRIRSPEGQVPITHIGLGVSVLVPWGETNRRHHLLVRIESEDGVEVARAEAQIELGRPPGATLGSDFRAVIAMNVDAQIQETGGYRVVAKLGEQLKSVSFRVHEQMPPGLPGQT